MAAASLIVLVGAGPVASRAESPSASAPAASFVSAYRRLTEGQYRNTIRDVFGPGIQINARFEPEKREQGLQAVGNARLSITTAGLEQYQSAARSIADQVIDGKTRDALIGCKPASAADAACASQFIAKRGAELFRRPLSKAEAARYQAIWENGAKGYGDFHKGLKLALTAMLISPDFLFRVERAEPDPSQAKAWRLDSYSTASRISYTLWNSAPDEELMKAAASGALATPAGLKAQVDRMIASPKLEDGVRAFFTDMMEFETFDTLSKDTATYPKYSQAVADSAREETLRFLAYHLVQKNEDYRDIFTTRETFINRTLAYVYNVPYLSTDKWSAYTFKPDSERSGVLTQVTFLSLFAHPGSSSPTVRGKALNEIFLCTEIPQPPPDVDFSKVQALDHGTVRTRLEDHMTNPGCAGCHRIMDPPGLTLERFDGLGQRRTMENNAPIDVAAELNGHKFSGAQGLGQYLHDDPRVTRCLVRRTHAYGVGRLSNQADNDSLSKLDKAFTDGGYRLPVLLRTLLNDPQFYRVAPPAGVGSGPIKTAMRTPEGHKTPGEAQ